MFNAEGIRIPKTLEIISGNDQEGLPGFGARQSRLWWRYEIKLIHPCRVYKSRSRLPVAAVRSV